MEGGEPVALHSLLSARRNYLMNRLNDSEVSTEARVKAQEVKFVEWSEKANAEDYDVKEILQKLNHFKKEHISVLDVGGGIGLVGQLLITDGSKKVSVDVVDKSVLAKKNFISHENLRLIFDDFLNMPTRNKYDVIIFRTVLHHIISDTSQSTRKLQNRALSKAYQLLDDGGKIFVVENFYNPLVSSDLTGEMIYQCTRLKALAPVFRRLGANTAGEGVRFRSYKSWMEMFDDNLFETADHVLGEAWNEPLPLWQRMSFLCKEKYQAIIELRKKPVD